MKRLFGPKTTWRGLRTHALLLAATAGCLTTGTVKAYELIGVGTGALIGNDLTDLANDGDPEVNDGYDATFDANDEPDFGGGESAFNVFDNILGPGNDKWCCGPGGGIPEDGLWVSAKLAGPHVLTSFTVSSANDVPDRDPTEWAVQGSNDGVNYTDIFKYEAGDSVWGDTRFQVAHFIGGVDFPKQTQAYNEFRFVTYNTASNPNGAYYQVGEIEFLGRPGANADGTPAAFVGGVGRIGDKVLNGTRTNEVYGPAQLGPGLLQSWYSAGNPGNKDGVDAIAESQDPVVPAFRAAHGSSWWTGNQEPFTDDLVKYPEEVLGAGVFNNNDNSNYVVKSSGQILIPESGTYRFTDGIDDYTYLAIDSNKSGTAGDVPEEVLIDDNAWTSVFRVDNNGGGGYGEANFNVAAGGEWLDFEFAMAEGGGTDAGIIYWDYNPSKPAGQRLGGNAGFPEDSTQPIDPTDAETMYIPNSHLRSDAASLISADIKATLTGTLPYEFDVDGTANAADKLVVSNANPALYDTVLDVNGKTFQIAARGNVVPNKAYKIIDADEIVGTPIITSATAGQTWVFDRTTGSVCLGSCPGGVQGDYSGNGVLDAADLDLQATAIGNNGPAGTYDLTGDGNVNYEDRLAWINTLKKTWIGDADLDGQFNSSDFVTVFQAGKFETGQAAGWAEGDWDGNKLFNTTDFVAAFQQGGYEAGPKAAVSAVPEPSSMALLALGSLGLLGARRRRG